MCIRDSVFALLEQTKPARLFLGDAANQRVEDVVVRLARRRGDDTRALEEVGVDVRAELAGPTRVLQLHELAEA